MTPLLGQVFNALDTQQKGCVGQQAVLQAMQAMLRSKRERSRALRQAQQERRETLLSAMTDAERDVLEEAKVSLEESG